MKYLFDSAGLLIFFLLKTDSYFNPDVGHESKQSKQLIHLEKSINLFLLSIHPALQYFSHEPHSRHVSSLIEILYRENFEINPSKEPTGQIELQNNLPFEYERIKTIMNKTIAKIRAVNSTPVNSIGVSKKIPSFSKLEFAKLFILIKSGLKIELVIFP